MDKPILFDPKKHAHLVSSLVHVHMTCITQPTYTIATFLPPLEERLMQSWWEDRAKEVAEGARHIIMQMATNPITQEEEVAGYAMLGMPFAQTGPFRGVVEKLLVLPSHRNKGVAKAIMLMVEEVAKREGRTLLLLDTEKGSLAETIYPRLGYVKVGEIPAYEISPVDGSLKDGVFFYKDLRAKRENHD